MKRLLLVLLCGASIGLALIAPAARANSLLLDSTSKSLELLTGSSSSTDYVVSWADHTASALTPGMSQGNIASATTTTLVSAPAGSTQRQIKWVSLRNRSTSATQTVTLKLDVSGTDYYLTPDIVLGPGERLAVDASGALEVFDRAGRDRIEPRVWVGSAQVAEFVKVGSTAEATATQYAYLKDSGFPAAWVPGTPGLNGANTDCSSSSGATVAGAPIIPNAAAGGNYLVASGLTTSAAHYVLLGDLQWYNTGISVTTTTAQAITFPTPVSRDADGSNLGAGVQAGLYVTTATTNAGATAPTISYTDQDNNAGATGTGTFPGTAVAGTFVPFQLAAGDTGVRSIQSITLGTSLVTGAVSLVTYRTLAGVPQFSSNTGTINPGAAQALTPGVRLWNGTCLFVRLHASSASVGMLLAGSVQWAER